MTVQPEILYRNLLAIAQAGRGDGTIYAWATSATVDQANKTFTLGGLSIMADLGADADDKFNGYQLVFPASGRSYLITDWVAATNIATVFEYPNVADTGACEIRRALYADDFDPAHPGRFACSGDLNKSWLGSAVNKGAVLAIAMPNGIDNGDFERNSTSGWTVAADGDGTLTANATAPLRGSYDGLLSFSTGTYVRASRVLEIALEAGKTYNILMIAKLLAGTSTTNAIVTLRYTDMDTAIIVNWDPEDTDDDAATTTSLWKLELSTTAQWKAAKFTVPEDLDVGDATIRLEWTGATDLYFDEMWIHELIQPDTFIVGGHNWIGGLPSGEAVTVRGVRCPSDRTSFAAGDKIDLLAYSAVTADGRSPIYATFTAPASIYPIYEIQLGGVGTKIWEAGEIWVGKRWTWAKFISGNWIPNDTRIEAKSTTTIGGVTRTSERYRKKRRGGSIKNMTATESLLWEAFLDEVGKDKPFWFRFPGVSALGKGAETIFMRNLSEDRPSTENIRFGVTYQFEEM